MCPCFIHKKWQALELSARETDIDDGDVAAQVTGKEMTSLERAKGDSRIRTHRTFVRAGRSIEPAGQIKRDNVGAIPALSLDNRNRISGFAARRALGSRSEQGIYDNTGSNVGHRGFNPDATRLDGGIARASRFVRARIAECDHRYCDTVARKRIRDDPSIPAVVARACEYRDTIANGGFMFRRNYVGSAVAGAAHQLK
jgi:hypothetical protein